MHPELCYRLPDAEKLDYILCRITMSSLVKSYNIYRLNSIVDGDSTPCFEIKYKAITGPNKSTEHTIATDGEFYASINPFRKWLMVGRGSSIPSIERIQMWIKQYVNQEIYVPA